VVGEDIAKNTFCNNALGKGVTATTVSTENTVYSDEFVKAQISLFDCQVTLGMLLSTLQLL
jgi:hypothetical protein